MYAAPVVCVCVPVVAFVDRSVPSSMWENGHFSQLRGYSAWLRDDASSRATQLTVECLLWVVFVVFVCAVLQGRSSTGDGRACDMLG